MITCKHCTRELEEDHKVPGTPVMHFCVKPDDDELDLDASGWEVTPATPQGISLHTMESRVDIGDSRGHHVVLSARDAVWIAQCIARRYADTA